MSAWGSIPKEESAENESTDLIYEALPTSLDSSLVAGLLSSVSRLGEPLSRSSSESAFLVLLSSGEEMEEVFRRLLFAGS